ncbi:MAG: DUF1905 domain-containing protein [Sphingobacteriales bacterium]|nr:MAG: DUF1905 domain-containing protein [Sphingobacteriales bacterium]
MHPLVNNKYQLERFDGKGGWTFVRIPELTKDKTRPFGWRKVKGRIDDYPIKKLSLMPMADGEMMLPVRAEIRKHINKRAGDWVQITLYPDTDVLEVPEELQLCLADEPRALNFFNQLTESEQKFYIDWIYNAKRAETRISRLTQTISRLQQGLKKYVKLPG